MKIITILIVTLFSTTTFSQTIKNVESNLEKKDFRLFKHFIQNIKPGEHCAHPDNTTYREVLSGYNEVVVNILLFVPTPKGKYEGDCNYYQINLLTKNNRIIKYALYAKQFNDKNTGNFRLLKEYSNNTEINAFNELYEKVFYRKLSMSELFDISVTYGARCGWAGINPKDKDILDEYVTSKNREKLFYWLTSPSFERKLYGYEGFKALKNKGYQLTEKENEIIKNLKNFKGPVRTCRGCSYMSEEFSEIINGFDR